MKNVTCVVCFFLDFMIEYIPVNVPIETIYEFHKTRTACHVASVNYFAGLLGYHFPEHDNDKNTEPMRTGYAYKNYASYHPEYKLLDKYVALFDAAHSAHHAHASHHIEYYGGDVAQIPDICLVEMVCDWFSASFEQVNIIHDYEYETVSGWFDAKLSHLDWTAAQLKTIRETINLIENRMNVADIMKIWAPVMRG